MNDELDLLVLALNKLCVLILMRVLLFRSGDIMIVFENSHSHCLYVYIDKYVAC